VSSLQLFGSLREIMHAGDLQGKVALADVADSASIGLGALSELRGEITAIDRQFWISYPTGTTTETQVTRRPTERAALFVTARVDGWAEHIVAEDTPLSKLSGIVVKAARHDQVYDPSQVLALRITGPFRYVDWHVIDGSRVKGGGHGAHVSASVRGRLEGKPPGASDLEVVGFHSDRHRGIFTHHDSPLHLHVVRRSTPLTGHVDNLIVAAGATIRLGRQ
jgi:acetolactate decarboxylase